MRRTLMIAALVLPLTACSAWTKSVRFDAKPVTELADDRAQPDPALVEDCDGPTALGDKPLGAGQAERDWGKDRKHLADCRDKHHETVKFYKERDRKLGLTR